MQVSPLEPLPDTEHAWLDPEHLIINGMGGAFLHPTHIFSGARISAKMATDTTFKKPHTYGSWSNVDLLNNPRSHALAVLMFTRNTKTS